MSRRGVKVAACEGHEVLFERDERTGFPVVRCWGPGCNWSATGIADRSLACAAGFRHVSEQRRRAEAGL